MLLLRCRETIRANRMIANGETVIAAVSGGVDSMVMLHVLCALRHEYAIRIVVCHLDHALRGSESGRDYSFVKDAAAGLGLRFAGRRLEPGWMNGAPGSVQEAARRERLGFLEETASRLGASSVALGHTLDDQAETVLMRMIKGSALSGLAGMAPVRGIFIRPLIAVTRDEVERVAGARGIPSVIDSSNLTDKYLRNDLRHNLMSLIRERYNPGIAQTLSRTAALLSADEEFIRLSAERVWRSSVLERSASEVVLDRRRLLRCHNAVLSRIFLMATGCFSAESDIYSNHVMSFIKVVRGGKPDARLSLPGLWLRREYERIMLGDSAPQAASPFCEALRVPGETRVPGAGCVFSSAVLKRPPRSFQADPAVAYFDYDSLEMPVTIRPMAPGDRMVPLGMSGSKKLKEIFIEQKVPRGARARVPVLFSGGEALWAPMLRQSGRFGVGASTRRVLRIRCTGLSAPWREAP